MSRYVKLSALRPSNYFFCLNEVLQTFAPLSAAVNYIY